MDPTFDELDLARMARQHFLQNLSAAIPRLDKLVLARFEKANPDDMLSFDVKINPQVWRTLYLQHRRTWATKLLTMWREAFSGGGSRAPASLDSMNKLEELSLIEDQVIDNLIASSRLSMKISDKVSAGFADLRKLLRRLEQRNLPDHDVVRPSVLTDNMLDCWVSSGMTKEAFVWVMDGILEEWAEQLNQSYAKAKAFLESKGIKAELVVTNHSRDAQGYAHSTGSAPLSPGPGAAQQPVHPGQLGGTAVQPGMPAQAIAPGMAQGVAMQPGQPLTGIMAAPGTVMHGVAAAGVPGGAVAGVPAGGYVMGAGGMPVIAGDVQALGPQTGIHTGIQAGGMQTGMHPGVYTGAKGAANAVVAAGGVLPILQAPAAAFGQKAISQVNALWSDIRNRLSMVVGNFAAAGPGAVAGSGQAVTGVGGGVALSTNLHKVLQQQASALQHLTGVIAQSQLASVDQKGAGEKIAKLARKQSDAIKEKAGQENEKAIIEMVALMFQSVLMEDRVPPSVRVLFARLQVPVLRIALSEPEFFRDMNHPVRRLIDRMGSSVMGFDGASFVGSALEHELRRIVLMIEQYPDTGTKIFQLALSEFERFLQKHLAENRSTSKAVSVAQQMEEKETLLVKFTIELRKMLQELPVKEEVRTFLFKTWAEALAVSAVRMGLKSAETQSLKRTASLLVWVTTGAKGSQRDRRRAIQALPKLQERLQQGLELVGIVDAAQEAVLKQLMTSVNETFLAKTQAIPAAVMKSMARRLDNLENFISDDSVADIDLSAENIEIMLGVEASGLVVLASNSTVEPPKEVMEWAQNRELGGWYTLAVRGKPAGGAAAAPGADRAGIQVQYVWHSKHRHLHLFASNEGATYLLKQKTLADFFQTGQLVPLDQEGLMLRATRVALTQFQSAPPEVERPQTMQASLGAQTRQPPLSPSGPQS